MGTQLPRTERGTAAPPLTFWPTLLWHGHPSQQLLGSSIFFPFSWLTECELHCLNCCILLQKCNDVLSVWCNTLVLIGRLYVVYWDYWFLLAAGMRTILQRRYQQDLCLHLFHYSSFQQHGRCTANPFSTRALTFILQSYKAPRTLYSDMLK